MSSPFGMYGGGGNYSSPEARALGSITADSYDYRDEGKTISKLVGDVSYLAGMSRKMQDGIDKANENFIQQIQSLIRDFFVIIGGGGDTGLDFGDLKYILQAIGALFGFDDGIIPINLFQAAWHFFSSYIIPTDNFHDLMDFIVDGIIATILDVFGEVPIVGQALQQLAVIIANIRDALGPLTDALDALFAAFGGDFGTGDLGPFGELWDTLMTLFGTMTAPLAAALAPVWPLLATFTEPFVEALTQIIEFVTNFIDVITGGVNTIDDFVGGAFNPVSILVNIIAALISGGLGSGIGMDWGGLVSGLFGIGGGDQTLFNQLAGNLRSFLGGADFTSGGFNLLTTAQTFLNTVLSPAGALSTATPIPGHLFGNLRPGTSSVNLFPDPSFDDASNLEGLGLWSWSSQGRTKAGSAHTTAAGVIRQLIGVPVPTNAGEITKLEGWLKWTGISVTAGQQFLLKAISYDKNDIVISDSTTVLASITAPGAASTGYGGNVSGWVNIKGQHQAPVGTSYVRFCLEISQTVIAGDIYLDDCIHQLDSGIVDASILTNIGNIPQLLGESVGGFQGIADLIKTLGSYTDGLGSAFSQGSSPTNIALPTLFSLAQVQTNNAIQAAFQAGLHQLILGNRTNKSQGMGANATSQSSLEAAHFSSGGTLTTTSLVAGNTIGQIYTVPEYATYGFVEIMASGTSVTNIYLNIYKIGTTNDTRTLLFTSANIATLIGSTVGHVRVLLPGMPMVNASDRLFIEICNNGSNALNVVAKATGIPNNTNEFIQNTAATRSILNYGLSPATILPGQSGYTGTVPYAVIGLSDIPADYMPPDKQDYIGAGSYSEPMPSWLDNGDFLDIIGIGGGGGGGSSLFYVGGASGNAATWSKQKLVVGTDIKKGSTYYWTVGGRGSSGGSSSSGGTGGTTTFTYTDPANNTQTLYFYGGSGGAYGGGNNGGGPGPGNILADLITYYGGAAVGRGETGQTPGGAGGGAIAYLNGTSGGAGQLSIYKAQS